jgi:hypothetical protein
MGPTIAADITRFPAGKIVIDGEVISADAMGRPNFSALQDDLKSGRHDRMVYYAFWLTAKLWYEQGFCPIGRSPERTALCRYWLARLREMPTLCSACDSKIGKWHGQFPQESAEGWKTDKRAVCSI